MNGKTLDEPAQELTNKLMDIIVEEDASLIHALQALGSAILIGAGDTPIEFNIESPTHILTLTPQKIETPTQLDS